MNVSDIILAHANGDAIREANGTSPKVMAEVKENKQVDLEDSIAEAESEEEVEVADSESVEITEDEGVESFDL